MTLKQQPPPGKVTAVILEYDFNSGIVYYIVNDIVF